MSEIQTNKRQKQKEIPKTIIPEEDDGMSFLDHLEALRWHLIRAFSSVIILAIIAFLFSRQLFDKVLLAPKTADFFTNKIFCEFGNYIGAESLCINTKPFQIISIKMAGQFSSDIMVSVIAGFIIAFPYVFWEIWAFIKPAFYENEKKNARGAVITSSLLFMIGVLFGYYIITPLSVHFLGSYNVSNQVINQIGLDSYISTIASITLASGVIFELPIVIYFLSKVGLVTPAFLKKYRRHAIVLIVIVAAVITPPDVFSQILVSLPLILLYEVGIKISARMERKYLAAFENTGEEAPIIRKSEMKTKY